MPTCCSGDSNGKPMNMSDPADLTRYGPVSVIGACTTMLALELITWAFAPWLLFALVVLPIVFVVVLGLSAALARAKGRVGQAGRGMMIGCIAAPLSIAVFVPVILIAHAIGPM